MPIKWKTLRFQKNLRLSLKTRYLILREIVIWMGLAEFILLGLGIYNWGTSSGSWYLLALAINYYVSDKLGYAVIAMLIRLENERKEK